MKNNVATPKELAEQFAATMRKAHRNPVVTAHADGSYSVKADGMPFDVTYGNATD